MATYYVRSTGSDAAAGTSAGAAWATLGKALGASGIASGDTVYVGAGVYREQVTVAMTSATAETKVIADLDGSHTGDAGEVRWSGMLTDDRTGTGPGTPVSLNGRDYLTFIGIAFEGPPAANTLTSTNITWTNCTFLMTGSQGAVGFTVRFDANVTWLFDSCTFLVLCGVSALGMQIDLNASADYDVGVIIKNCLFLTFSGQPCIRITAGGSGSFKGGGVVIYNCTLISGCAASSLGAIAVVSANISTTFPCKVYNSICIGSQNGLFANTSGQITSDYNLVIGASAALGNVTAGSHDRTGGPGPPISLYMECGQSERAGLRPRHWFTPGDLSGLLGWGAQASGPTVDLLGIPRPSGGARVMDSGTATSGAAGTITDTNKAWKTNYHAGRTVHITGGTGSGQYKHIVSNTATALTVSGNWATNPDNTSTYKIEEGAPSTSGKATSGAATSLTDSGASWGTTRWIGATLEIVSGTGSGQTKTITSHTATVLTVSTWTTNPDSTSVYKIYFVAQGAQQYSVGALERGGTVRKETTTVDAGSNAIAGYGCFTQDFVLPVDATSTTIGIKSQFDSAYGAGTKPRMSILNGAEIGVADATSTSTQTAGNWYSHSLTFTPTAKGFITVRVAAFGAVDSKTAFDTFTKT